MDQKLSWKEKISYGLGDTASNLIYTVVSTYLTFYFTDVYGISAAAVGTLLLLVRFIDMFDSPIIGVLIDKTSTRWGKSRPWLLWFCVPFAASAILMFMGPDLSESGKVAWAYITYICVSIFYAAVNTPINTLLPNLTNDIEERTVANTIRMFCGQIGGLIVNLSLLPLVAFFGAGNQQRGFFFTMTLFAVVGVVMFLITFLNTRERVQSVDGNDSVPFKESIKVLKGSKIWISVASLSLFFFMAYIVKASSAIYYITYNIERPDLVSLVNTLGMLSIVGILAVPFITKVMSKRTTVILGLILTIIGQLVMYFAHQSIAILIIGTVISAIGLGFPAGLIFVLMADIVDYGEWKTGIRAQGLLGAVASMGGKFGSGLGGALPAWLLAAGHYVANEKQTASALNMIEISYIWVPIILCIGAIISMMFYKFEKPHAEINQELQARRLAVK